MGERKYVLTSRPKPSDRISVAVTRELYDRLKHAIDTHSLHPTLRSVVCVAIEDWIERQGTSADD